MAVPTLLAPPVFGLVSEMAAAVDGPSWLEKATFARVFQRLLTIGALGVGIPWFYGRRVRDRAGFGLGGDGAMRLILNGMAFGAVLAVLQLSMHLVTGARDWEPDLGWGDVGRIVMAALAAGFFEEVLFRGALLGVMLRSMRSVTANLLQAAVFATVHFLKPPGFGEGYEVHAGSGFALVGSISSAIADEPFRWLMLALLGAVLGAMAVRWRNIWWCFGFHMIVAAGAMLLPKLTDYEGGPWRFLCEKDPSAGLDGVMLLGVVLWIVWPRPALRDRA